MRSCLLLLCCLPALSIIAQDHGDEDAIRTVITTLFDAMRASDSAAIRPLMHPELRMMTVGSGGPDGPALRQGSLQAWLEGVGSAEPGAYDERVWSYAIQVDGDLATAWTPYTFVLNGQPHHCGVNAFQLLRQAAGWVIFQITDTRRDGPCVQDAEDEQTYLNALIDGWHQAAARADAEAFFGAMAPDGIYIGTDPGERWTRDELRDWAQDAFARDTAWAFQPVRRHLTIAADGGTAWWDELLDTWMGPCRATGILRRQDGDWKIQHFQLSVALPNEQMPAYLELINP